MKIRALLVMALLLAAAPVQAKQKAPAAPPGWAAEGKARSYDSKTVWKVINGAAELYLSYGMTRLDLHTLGKGDTRLALHVYHLGSDLDAIGVFLRERPEQARALEGTGVMAAFAAPGHCLAFGDSRYLRLQLKAGKLSSKVCARLLAHAARSLKLGTSPPPALALLPKEDRARGSLGYTRASFLGLRELGNCLHARYGKKGKLTRFVMLAADSKAAAVIKRLGDKWKVHTPGERKVWHRKVPYKGTVALVRVKAGFAGVAGAGDLAASLKLLKEE